jgi:adenine phosphoribosyltransferase
MNLKDKITEYPNFPKKGILFRDFSPILKDPSSLSHIADEFSKHFHPKDVDVFVGIESRGFLLATILALKYNKGIVMIRKAGQKVVICDDLLATGGTAKASAKLIEKVGGKITGFAFIIELTGLNGIKGLSKYNCKSLVKY